MDEELRSIFAGIMEREQRTVLGLPPDPLPNTSVLTTAELHGSMLRNMTVAAANGHGHAMSDYQSVCGGLPEEGRVALCTNAGCTCFVYHQTGADRIMVFGIDAACPSRYDAS